MSTIDKSDRIHIAQESLEGVFTHLQNLKCSVNRVATTSKQRIKFRTKMNDLRKKAKDLIEQISENSVYRVSDEDFEKGFFPWQNLESKESADQNSN